MKARRFLNNLIAWTGYELVHRSKKRGVDWLADVKALIPGNASKLIIDVGAHEGESVKRFRHFFPNATIHSFEPGEETFARLRRNLSSENREQIHLHQTALGAGNGDGELFINENSATNSLLPVSAHASELLKKDILVAKSRAHVNMRTLDSFCLEHGIDRIDLLKIDVQGYELEVLRGAFRLLSEKRVRAVFLEVFFVPVYQGQAFFEEVYLFLKQANYRFSGLYDLSYQSEASPRWGDALFLA